MRAKLATKILAVALVLGGCGSTVQAEHSRTDGGFASGEAGPDDPA